MKTINLFITLVAIVLIAFDQLASDPNKTLLSQFSSQKVFVDGKMDSVWNLAPAERIEKVSPINSSSAEDCRTSGTVRSLWDGASLYFLIEVEDDEISTSAEKLMDQDGVTVFLDLMNDKFPKYMEDDGLLFVSAKGERMTRGTDTERFGESAVSYVVNARGDTLGYTVEVAIQLGGIPIENETSIGIEIGINDLDYRVFWSSDQNHELHDNSKWGTIELRGYDDTTKKALDYFGLWSQLQKAKKIVLGIWQDQMGFKKALKKAETAMNSTDQMVIDEALEDLSNTIEDLRRKGAFPDPYDLPETEFLPDPFKFLDGQKVQNEADWVERVEEVKKLAQYYEYGTMPKKPEQVVAKLSDKKLLVSVTDQGKTVDFEAQLTLPKENPKGWDRIPVIVSIDFFIREADSIYLNAGYAVLNFRYTSVASDDNKHLGPFYELYPYDVQKSQDAGTLLAWAWGASRCVDALEFLDQTQSEISGKLNLDRIAVTGFSRCGKAALAAGFFDERFGVVNPGASGCGGAAVYRYVSHGGPPKREYPYGNEYEWGRSPGCEVLGDKVRHQGHNSNEMLPRFLNPNRIYETQTFGYGERLPYDHHQIIGAIAPRGVLITTANNDYANNAEGDALGLEGAKPVFEFLNVPENLALNLRTTGEVHPRWSWAGGHFISPDQKKNLVHFCNMVFYKESLPDVTREKFYSNPYLKIIDKYYGGKKIMMPWLY